MSFDPHSIMPWLLGGLGGVLPDVLRILNIIKSGQPLTGVFTWRLWVSLLILIPLGGFTAWLLEAATPIQALACGFSAPEVLSRILSDSSNLPPPGGHGGPTSFSTPGAAPAPGLRSWWSL
jgi:hypothetical protein